MSGATPELSVIVASHNRRELLRRCLDSLRDQEADPAGFEVIIADDGSADGTAEMVEAYEAPFRLRVLRLEQGGKSAALNAAIPAADGAVCLFLDDDIIASPQLIGAHLEAHRRNPATLGIGAIIQRPIEANDWYAHSFAQGWNEHFAEKPEGRIGWAECYGANFSAPRASLLEVGPFKELVTAEDIEMGFRLERAGCVPTFLPRAHGVHDDQKPGRGMLAGQCEQGRVHVELARRYPEMRDGLLPPWNQTALPGELPLRRMLIELRLPPRALVVVGRLLPGSGRKMLWLHLVRRFAFWRSARECMSRGEWRALTGGQAR